MAQLNSNWVHMGSMWVQIRFKLGKWFQMGKSGSKWVQMGQNEIQMGLIWVQMVQI